MSPKRNKRDFDEVYMDFLSLMHGSMTGEDILNEGEGIDAPLLGYLHECCTTQTVPDPQGLDKFLDEYAKDNFVEDD